MKKKKSQRFEFLSDKLVLRMQKINAKSEKKKKKKQQTSFKIKHLYKHKCDVNTSHSKGVFPQCSITFLLSEKILERFLDEKSFIGSEDT